jgi:AP-1 complex subunit sigma 1/2
MSPNLCWQDVLGCATFSNIKVRRAAPHGKYTTSLTAHADSKIVYRRYASLFFIAGCSSTDNELITLEIVHRYVEQMDKYYGNVCELDIIFNFQKAYFILDELLLAGEMQESSKKNVLKCIGQQDTLEEMEVSLKRPFGRLFSALPSSYFFPTVGLPRHICRQLLTPNFHRFRSKKTSRKSCNQRIMYNWVLDWGGARRIQTTNQTILACSHWVSFANSGITFLL